MQILTHTGKLCEIMSKQGQVVAVGQLSWLHIALRLIVFSIGADAVSIVLTRASVDRLESAQYSVKRRQKSSSRLNTTSVLGVEILRDLRSIYGYQFERPTSFWKIYLSMPTLVPATRTLLENGVTFPGILFSFEPYAMDYIELHSQTRCWV